jgi:hypothetical protein
MRQQRIADDRLGLTRPHMDGKFFRLADGRWASLMDHELNQGDLSEVHLAAVADQVLWQVIKGLNLWGEILLTGPIHLTRKWTSPLIRPRRTLQDLVDHHGDASPICGDA